MSFPLRRPPSTDAGGIIPSGFSTRLEANRYGPSIAIANPSDRNGQLTTLETDEGGTEWNYSSSEWIHCYKNQALNRY